MMPPGAAAVGVLPPSRNSIPVILVSREATSEQAISLTLWALSLMMVAPIPAPCSVIALLIVKVVDQVNVPAGSVIVSPFSTAFCRPCTLATEPSDWYVVAPQRRAGKPLQIRINRRIFPDTFMTAAYRSLRYAAVTGIKINSHGKQNFSKLGNLFWGLPNDRRNSPFFSMLSKLFLSQALHQPSHSGYQLRIAPRRRARGSSLMNSLSR